MYKKYQLEKKKNTKKSPSFASQLQHNTGRVTAAVSPTCEHAKDGGTATLSFFFTPCTRGRGKGAGGAYPETDGRSEDANIVATELVFAFRSTTAGSEK